MKIRIFLLIFFSIILHLINSNESYASDKSLFGKKREFIWENTNQWTDEWEFKYAQWLQETVTVDFYQKYNIPTDCADAVVGLRWIFSRINGLPAANTVNSRGELFGNFSMPRKWQKLKTANLWYEDELFMSALSYVMNASSTQTVIDDGYPVKIDRSGLIAGTYIITQNKDSGHVKVINETHFDELTELPFYTFASTTPRSVRSLVRETFVDQEWPLKSTKEVLAFRWPVFKDSKWILKPKEEHSRFSLEQFDLSLKKKYPAFISFILSRVKENYDPVKLVEYGTTEITEYIKMRIDIVNNGSNACRNNSCAIGSGEYESWSTENRDQKLIKKFSSLDSFVREFENISPGLNDYWFNSLRNSNVVIEGQVFSLSNIRYLFEHQFTSSNPNHSTRTRWGLDSSKVLSDWMIKIESLLINRQITIAKRTTPCGDECFPKNNEWLIGNTYSIDRDLNQQYVDIRSYCNVVGENSCKLNLNYMFKKNMFLGGMNKSLFAWFELIPFFHSDPRVSFDRRWGILPTNIQALILPRFETIKISKNNLALLDNKKIINLLQGNQVYEAPLNSRLVLTDEGEVFLINDIDGSIHTMNQLAISDPDNLLGQFKDRKISYFEDDGVGVFRKVIPGAIIVFRIRNEKIELINRYTGKFQQIGPLLSMVQNLTSITFSDLDRNQIFEFSLPIGPEFKDMNKLNILSYKYPIIFAEYADQDWGLHFPIKINLEKKSWDQIDLGFSEAFSIEWSSANLKKAFIKTSLNNELPELYGLDFTSSPSVSIKLENNLVDALEVNNSIYFIQSSGSQWSQDLVNHLTIWNDSIFQTATNNLGNPKFLNTFGVYYSGADSGTLIDYHSQISLKLPKFIASPNDFYNLQLSNPGMFNFRFDSSYGDFLGMGESLNLSDDLLNNLDKTILPEFSIYSWINKTDLQSERWQKTFSHSRIKSGTLISIGQNVCIWWKPLGKK